MSARGSPPVKTYDLMKVQSPAISTFRHISSTWKSTFDASRFLYISLLVQNAHAFPQSQGTKTVIDRSSLPTTILFSFSMQEISFLSIVSKVCIVEP